MGHFHMHQLTLPILGSRFHPDPSPQVQVVLAWEPLHESAKGQIQCKQTGLFCQSKETRSDRGPRAAAPAIPKASRRLRQLNRESPGPIWCVFLAIASLCRNWSDKFRTMLTHAQCPVVPSTNGQRYVLCFGRLVNSLMALLRPRKTARPLPPSLPGGH